MQARWGRLRALLRGARGRPEAGGAAGAPVADLAGVRDGLDALGPQVERLVSQAGALLAGERVRRAELAKLAALPVARLLSRRLTLEGPPSRRVTVRRHRFGEPARMPVRPWLGVEHCATDTPAIRESWTRLVEGERASADGVLAEVSRTVLEMTDAVVSRGDALRVSLDTPASPPGGDTVPVGVVPRFAYDMPPRKLRNFGHWLIDCVPHVHELLTLAPAATFLLPPPYRDVHWRALELAGLSRDRVRPWNGEPVSCRHLFVQETDGRVSRGRPLSPLRTLHRRFAGEAPPPAGRRLYVSRRDARPHRQWLANPDAVEALFRSRGFDVLTMRDHPLDAQVGLFGEAAVVAGVSGAGLSGIVFSPPGVHVIAILTDSLMRWYAEDQASRAAWARGPLVVGDALNELSDSPRFYPYLAAVCEQTCHTFVGGDVLPIDRLGAFLDDVLVRAGDGGDGRG